MPDTAYAGTRVIEIASGVTAGVTGRIFADLGADVVRYEHDTETVVEPGEQAVRTWARARKRTVADTPLSLDALAPLLDGADLVVSDLDAARWSERLPSPQSIVADHPGLVLVDATRFGRVGPYADYESPDLVSLALSGYLYMCGLNSREPLRVGPDVVGVATGVNAAGGAMAALHHARRSGQGQVVEVSTLRTMLGTGTSFPISYAYQGTVRRRSASRIAGVGAMIPCADGHVFISTYRISTDLMFVLLGDDRLLDERFDDYFGRETHQGELVDIMREAAAGKTMRELFEFGQELRMQNAMVQSPRQTPRCPQHEYRHFFQPLVLDDGRTVPAPVTPTLPASDRHDRSHTPGDMIVAGRRPEWREASATPEVDLDPTADAASPRRALEGLKVVELTFAWAGPYIGRILADHGAQVVKLESRTYVDTAKGVDLADLSFGDADRWTDRSLAYVVANPAKYHVGMELTDPAGRDVLLDLVRWADVVIENYTPRVLPNLGIGWELFRSVNPSLVMISATGFGQAGPYRDHGAWGWGLECQAGVTFQTGYRDDPDPLMLVPTVPDPLSATTGVAAVLAALEHRRRTGRGQWIDLSQYECATFSTLVDTLRSAASDLDRPRVGNRHAWRAPQGVYPSTGDDAWVAVAVERDEQWIALCSVIDRPDLAGEAALATHAGRQAHHDRIDDAIAAWTRVRTKHDAMHRLQDGGVPAGAVLHAKDLTADPHIEAMAYYRAAWGLELGLRVWPGPWHAMEGTPGDVERGTSVFGEDNARVLRDLLGYDEPTIERLVAGSAFSDAQDGLQRPSAPSAPVETMLERGTILSWDQDYRSIPARIAERDQQWRQARGLPPKRTDGRDD